MLPTTKVQATIRMIASLVLWSWVGLMHNMLADGDVAMAEMVT